MGIGHPDFRKLSGKIKAGAAAGNLFCQCPNDCNNRSIKKLCALITLFQFCNDANAQFFDWCPLSKNRMPFYGISGKAQKVMYLGIEPFWGGYGTLKKTI